jgi:copper homeostasis protein
VATIVAGTAAREIHFTAGAAHDSRMEHRNPRVFMGGALRPPEYVVNTTDAERVRAVIAASTGSQTGND